jgi:hypothetical protein
VTQEDMNSSAMMNLDSKKEARSDDPFCEITKTIVSGFMTDLKAMLLSALAATVRDKCFIKADGAAAVFRNPKVHS